MATFAFVARGTSGQAVKGLRVADSEGALAPALAAEGLFLVRAEPAPAPRPGRARPGDLPFLLLHLAAYLEAGLPLLWALRDFRDPERPGLEALVLDMAGRLQEGASLSAIMAAHPALFQPLHVGMVRAGEAAGRLDPALRAVIRLAEWQGALRAQVRRAAIYPLVLLGVLTAVALVVCTWSLPPVLRLLEELGVPLPWVTRALLTLGRQAPRYGWLLLALPPVLRLGLRRALRRPGFRLAWDTALLRLPGAGPLLSRMALARFAHVLAAQHRAGLPLVQALRRCEDVTGNARIGLGVRAIRTGVEQGGGLAASAARAVHIPQLVIRMLALGEETGHLEEALEKVAAHFDGEVDKRVHLFFQVVDPAIKVLLALLLIFVATAVLLPLYTLIGGIHG